MTALLRCSDFQKALPSLLATTLFGQITQDLFPLISAYFHADRATLKPNYRFQQVIGSKTFNRPLDVAIDHTGKYYVADIWGGKIQIFSASGEFILSFSELGECGNHLGKPAALDFDRDGNLVVIDRELSEGFGRIGKPGCTGFDSPVGLSIDNDWRIIISDTCKNRIQIFSPQLEFLSIIGEAGSRPGQLLGPTSAVINGEGNVIVCDNGNNRIQILSPSGAFLRAFGTRGRLAGELSSPWGITVDKLGSIIVSDCGNGRIQVFSPEGEFVKVIGSSGKAKGNISYPGTATLDKHGNLVIADADNSRISIFG